MKLWRVAAETRSYGATDLSAAGAAKSPGGWNDFGEPVVYAAMTISMAVLETAAHVVDLGLPLNRYVVEIDIPDLVWGRRAEVDSDSLPKTWSSIPAGRTSVAVGSKWLKSQATLVLLVPSVIVPEESTALLNPTHPDAGLARARVVRSVEYNRLFRRF